MFTVKGQKNKTQSNSRPLTFTCGSGIKWKFYGKMEEKTQLYTHETCGHVSLLWYVVM